MPDDIWLDDLPACPPCKRGDHSTCTDTLPLQAYYMPGFGLMACECADPLCQVRGIAAATDEAEASS